MVKQKLSNEEKKAKRREYNAKFREENKEYQKEYYKKNKETLKLQNSEYYKKNKIKRKESSAIYREANKVKLAEQKKIYYVENKEYFKVYKHEHYIKNKLEHNKKCRENYIENKDKYIRAAKASYVDLRSKIFEILGTKCMICGEETEKFLTIDHINNNGAERRKKFKCPAGELWDLKKRDWPEEEIKSSLQTLCFNHNLGKNRVHLNEDPSALTKHQRYQQKLWKEAFNFFGPCHCGESNLQFLTIDHIRDDGAERRRNGEKDSSSLLADFRKQGWPESLKEDFQMLCFNHNCAKGK